MDDFWDSMPPERRLEIEAMLRDTEEKAKRGELKFIPYEEFKARLEAKLRSCGPKKE